MRLALAFVAGFIALVSFVALLEHVQPILGIEWLNAVLPFGIARRPFWLLGILFIAAPAAWLLLRRVQEQ